MYQYQTTPVTPPLGSNLDYGYDPTDIIIPGMGRVKRNSELGQMLALHYPTQPKSRPATADLIQEANPPAPINPRYLLTGGEGYAAYGDNELSWRKNPTASNQGAMPMLAGEDMYDPVISGWLQGNQVNPETKTTPADIRTRQGVKSRWEPFTQTESGLQPVPVGDVPINQHGFFDLTANHPKVQKLRQLNDTGQLKWQYVERPITSGIQNLADTSPQAMSALRAAQDWGEDTSKFYQSAVTPEMLDRGLFTQRQLQSVDQVLGAVNREEAYQQQLRNLESREIYKGSRDEALPYTEIASQQASIKAGKPRSWISDAEPWETNYNLAIPKNLSTAEDIAVGDTYRQEMGERRPDDYRAYVGGTPVYNERGILTNFAGDVEQASHITSILPESNFYSTAPQWALADPRKPKRNIVRIPTTAETPVVDVTRNEFGLATGLAPVQKTPHLAQWFSKTDEYKSPDYIKGQGLGRLDLDNSDIPAMQKQQELLRQHLAAETLQPTGNITMSSGKETYHPMNFTPGKAIPGVFEQVVDKQGNPVMSDVLDSSGKPVMVNQYSSEGKLSQVPQRRAQVVPFVPARDPVFRDEQLGNAMVQVGEQLVPYAGSAGVSLGKTELVRDPSIVPDAVDAIQQLERSGRNQLAQGNVNASSPTASAGATARAYAGANTAAQQLSGTHEAMRALQAVDPAMNVESQQFDVDVNVRPGAAGNAVYDLMSKHGLSPVASAAGDYDRITASGELPVGEQVKLAQGLRRTLAPRQIADTAIADPELAQLRNQWQDERAAVMGRTADQLAEIKQLHGERRLDRVGRPVGKQAINKMASAIENANYGDDMRRNLNFLPDDDWGMLSEDVHPLDRVTVVPSSSFQMQMAAENPAAFDWNPSSSSPEYMGQRRPVATPGGQMVHTPPFDWNPSQAEPNYTGQGRPAPGGGMIHAPVETPWYRTKAGMLGLGGAAALTLGALAYNQMKQKQEEEDLRSQQLMQMTGWR